MSVLINFKICDNAKECGGVEVCSTGALSWDDENRTIRIDNSKCTGCGLCQNACDVHAIQVAQTDDEYQRLKKEINDDPRTLSDLWIDRYGAQPIFEACLIGERQFDDQVLDYGRLAVVEFFEDETIECMLKSIPIKQLLDGGDARYRKVKISSNNLLEKYDVAKLPALLFFKNGKLLGKIEGYYTADDADKLKDKIRQITGG